MKKFIVAMLTVILVMAGIAVSTSAETESKFKFTVVTADKTETKNMTLSNVLKKYVNSETAVTIVAPYGATDITLLNSATVGKNVTLVLPCTEGQTSTDKTAVNPDLSDGTTQNQVSLITIKNKAKLTVKGTVVVSGQTGRSGAVHNVVTGNYGQLQVKTGATVTIASGGKFYNYGYVTGAGAMYAKKGAEVKDLYQIARFVGGGELLKLFGVQGEDTAGALRSYMSNGISEDEYPFPLPEAGSGNISLPTRYADGSVLIGTAKIYANSGENACEAMLIGDDGLYVQDGGYIWKKSTLSKDRFNTLNKETYSCYGKCKLGSTSVEINLLDGLFMMDLTSEKFVYSICGNVTLRVMKDAELTVDHAFKFLPGSVLEVQEGGTLSLNSLPDNGKFGAKKLDAVISGTASSGYLVFCESVRGAYGAGTTPAQLKIDGTVDLNRKGYIFGLNENTLTIGSNGQLLVDCRHEKAIEEWQIPETYNESGAIEAHQKITVTANWEYINGVQTADHTYGTWKETKSGLTHYAGCGKCKQTIKSNVSFKYNGEGSHASVCGNSACTLCKDVEYTACTWDEGVETLAATCTAVGETTYTCSVCSGTKAVEVAALGHTLGEASVVTKEPTCTETGIGSGICTVCNQEAEQTVIPALEHEYQKNDLEAPTCTSGGVVAYTCSRVINGETCGHYYTENVDALGHDYKVAAVEGPSSVSAGSVNYVCSREGCEVTKTSDSIFGGSLTSNGTSARLAVTNEYGMAAFIEKGIVDPSELLVRIAMTNIPNLKIEETKSYGWDLSTSSSHGPVDLATALEALRNLNGVTISANVCGVDFTYLVDVSETDASETDAAYIVSADPTDAEAAQKAWDEFSQYFVVTHNIVEETPEVEVPEQEGTTPETEEDSNASEGETDENQNGGFDWSDIPGFIPDTDSSDEGSSDDSASNEGSSDDSASNEGSSDDSASNEGSSDDSASNEGSSDDGASNEGSSDDGASNEGSSGSIPWDDLFNNFPSADDSNSSVVSDGTTSSKGDSKAIVKEGAWVQIGTEKLVIQSDMVLDNANNLGGLNTTLRDHSVLEKGLSESLIAVSIPAGTSLTVGSSKIEFVKDLEYAISGLELSESYLTSLQSATNFDGVLTVLYVAVEDALQEVNEESQIAVTAKVVGEEPVVPPTEGEEVVDPEIPEGNSDKDEEEVIVPEFPNIELDDDDDNSGFPEIEIPEVEIPEGNDSNLPEVEIPEVEIPDILPDGDGEGTELPDFDFSDLELPDYSGELAPETADNSMAVLFAVLCAVSAAVVLKKRKSFE